VRFALRQAEEISLSAFGLQAGGPLFAFHELDGGVGDAGLRLQELVDLERARP
jgi:hypothetical protein